MTTMTTPTIAQWAAFTTVGPDTFVDYADVVGQALTGLQADGADQATIETLAEEVLALRDLVYGQQRTINGEIPAHVAKIGDQLRQARLSLHSDQPGLLEGVRATLSSKSSRPAWVKVYRPRQVPRILDHIDDAVQVINRKLSEYHIPAGRKKNVKINRALRTRTNLENALSDLQLLRDTILGDRNHPLSTLRSRLLSNEALLKLANHRWVVPLVAELRDLYAQPEKERAIWPGDNLLAAAVDEMPIEGSRRLGLEPLAREYLIDDPSFLSDDQRHILESF